jgi:hypothetical protein
MLGCQCIFDGRGNFLIGELVSGTNGSRRSYWREVGDSEVGGDVDPGSFARTGDA